MVYYFIISSQLVIVFFIKKVREIFFYALSTTTIRPTILHVALLASHTQTGTGVFQTPQFRPCLYPSDSRRNKGQTRYASSPGITTFQRQHEKR